MAQRPPVSVVIPSYNGAEKLPRLISALGKTSYRDFHVIVVDNGSTDGTAHVAETCLRENALQGRVLIREKDHIASSARNEGFRASTGELVVFADDDVRPVWPEWLDVLVEFMSGHDDAGMAGPAVVSPDGETLQFGGLQGFLHGYYRDPLGGKRYADIPKAPVRVNSLIGPMLIGRRKVLTEIGPWDEKLDPQMFEETDFMWRISTYGASIYWVPAARVIHDGGASFQRRVPDAILQRSMRHSFRSVLKNAPVSTVPIELAWVFMATAAAHPWRALGMLPGVIRWNLQLLPDTFMHREAMKQLKGRFSRNA